MTRTQADSIIDQARQQIDAWKQTLLAQAGRGVIVDGRAVTLKPQPAPERPVVEPPQYDLVIWTRGQGQIGGEGFTLDWACSGILRPNGAVQRAGHLDNLQVFDLTLPDVGKYSRTVRLEAEARLHPSTGGSTLPPEMREEGSLYSRRVTLHLEEREQINMAYLIGVQTMGAPGSRLLRASQSGITCVLNLVAITF